MLGVCGGDGTLARTLSALVRAYGGGRAAAHPAAARRDDEHRGARHGLLGLAAGAHAGARSSPSYRRGEPLDATEHQLMRVNGSDYGFMVGAGVPVEFLRVYYDQPQRGARAALRRARRA